MCHASPQLPHSPKGCTHSNLGLQSRARCPRRSAAAPRWRSSCSPPPLAPGSPAVAAEKAAPTVISSASCPVYFVRAAPRTLPAVLPSLVCPSLPHIAALNLPLPPPAQMDRWLPEQRSVWPAWRVIFSASAVRSVFPIPSAFIWHPERRVCPWQLRSLLLPNALRSQTAPKTSQPTCACDMAPSIESMRQLCNATLSER